MMHDSQEEKQKHDNVSSRNGWKRYLPQVTLMLIVLILVISIAGIVTTFSPNDNPPDLAFSLKPIGNLTTVQVKAAKVGVEVEMRSGLCTLGSRYVVNGIVEAGIDLTGFSDSNIQYNDKTETYSITVPEPHLTRCEFNTEPYTSWNTLCGEDQRFKNDLDNIAQYVSNSGIVADVISGGILERTRRESAILIENIVKVLTKRTVSVEFVAPSTGVETPPTCNPQQPQNWEQNSQGHWIPDNTR